jgi:SEC-C motif-containing protein
MLCPCQSKKTYQACCEPFIMNTALAEFPKQLMRSRYTAYTQANIDYIAATMRGKAIEGFDKVAAKNWASGVEWCGLKVLRAPKPQIYYGMVEFIASYQEEGVKHKLYEISEFERADVDSAWYYIGQKKS